MKSLFFVFAASLLVVSSCTKEEFIEEEIVLSAESQFNSIEAPCKVSREISQAVNFFVRSLAEIPPNSTLFFDNGVEDIELGDVWKSLWIVGHKNLCCVCRFSGNSLLGGSSIFIYLAEEKTTLKSPSNSLVIQDVRIKLDEEEIIIQLSSMDGEYKYYGIYDLKNETLVMD